MKFDPTQGIYLCINSEKSESFYKFGLNAARERVQSRLADPDSDVLFGSGSVF